MALPRNLSILAQGANATGVLGASKGGTNLTAFVTNGALYATSTTALASGTLPVASGGTGITAFGTGVATALGQAVTGTGGMVLSTNATITTPTLSAEVYSTTANVTAGTNAQGSGALTSDYNIITTAANNPSGVTLPTATIGRRMIIVNRGANTVNVYPATGAAIDGLATNASIALPVNGWMEFNAASTTLWYSTNNLTTTSSGGVTTISFGSTGLTPNTATNGAVTVAGTLAVGSGGTNATTLTQYGVLVGNGTNTVAVTAAGTLNYGLIGQGSANPTWNYVNPIGGDSSRAFNINALTVSANYTIPTSYSAMSTGPITVNANVTVTIPSGSKWVVL